MNVGDVVRTTEEWNWAYLMPEGIAGVVVKIVEPGPNPYQPQRTHCVKMVRPLTHNMGTAWFDPQFLELDD